MSELLIKASMFIALSFCMTAFLTSAIVVVSTLTQFFVLLWDGLMTWWR